VAARGSELLVKRWSPGHRAAKSEDTRVIRHGTTRAEPASPRIGPSRPPEGRPPQKGWLDGGSPRAGPTHPTVVFGPLDGGSARSAGDSTRDEAALAASPRSGAGSPSEGCPPPKGWLEGGSSFGRSFSPDGGLRTARRRAGTAGEQLDSQRRVRSRCSTERTASDLERVALWLGRLAGYGRSRRRRCPRSAGLHRPRIRSDVDCLARRFGRRTWTTRQVLPRRRLLSEGDGISAGGDTGGASRAGCVRAARIISRPRAVRLVKAPRSPIRFAWRVFGLTTVGAGPSRGPTCSSTGEAEPVKGHKPRAGAVERAVGRRGRLEWGREPSSLGFVSSLRAIDGVTGQRRPTLLAAILRRRAEARGIRSEPRRVRIEVVYVAKPVDQRGSHVGGDAGVPRGTRPHARRVFSVSGREEVAAEGALGIAHPARRVDRCREWAESGLRGNSKVLAEPVRDSFGCDVWWRGDLGHRATPDIARQAPRGPLCEAGSCVYVVDVDIVWAASPTDRGRFEAQRLPRQLGSAGTTPRRQRRGERSDRGRRDRAFALGMKVAHAPHR
jgi:hypothetical protein